MRIQPVAMLNGGEVLAEPVRAGETVLIPGGTVLKPEYLSILRSLGISSLLIEDSDSLPEDTQPILSEERMRAYTGRTQKLLENHIHGGQRALYGLSAVANELVKEVNGIPQNAVFDVRERMADLYEHTVMVALLSLLVARRLGLEDERLYDLALGCLLHDIGIRYITTEYENRNWQTADAADVFEYKKHTILGYSALDTADWIPEIAKKMVLSHHERLDGSGFPLRQKSRETECRIIQVCDAFDSGISGIGCERIPVGQAYEQLVSDAGRRFAPEVAESLFSMISTRRTK